IHLHARSTRVRRIIQPQLLALLQLHGKDRVPALRMARAAEAALTKRAGTKVHAVGALPVAGIFYAGNHRNGIEAMVALGYIARAIGAGAVAFVTVENT